MNNSEMSIPAIIVATFINELFVDGPDSEAISLLRKGLKSDDSESSVRGIINKVINYFECSEKPIEDLLYFIGVEKKETVNDEGVINTLLYMDNNKIPFLSCAPLSGDGIIILNAALGLYFVGMENNANDLARIGVKLVMEEVFRDEMSLREFNDIAQKAISEAQREKAKKPRNPYYSEVIEVIRLTWEKYPCGSKTALLDALTANYHGKVSRNSLDNWISLSGLRPPIPEKYTRLELVFPH